MVAAIKNCDISIGYAASGPSISMRPRWPAARLVGQVFEKDGINCAPESNRELVDLTACGVCRASLYT